MDIEQIDNPKDYVAQRLRRLARLTISHSKVEAELVSILNELRPLLPVRLTETDEYPVMLTSIYYYLEEGQFLIDEYLEALLTKFERAISRSLIKEAQIGGLIKHILTVAERYHLTVAQYIDSSGKLTAYFTKEFVVRFLLPTKPAKKITYDPDKVYTLQVSSSMVPVYLVAFSEERAAPSTFGELMEIIEEEKVYYQNKLITLGDEREKILRRIKDVCRKITPISQQYIVIKPYEKKGVFTELLICRKDAFLQTLRPWLNG